MINRVKIEVLGAGYTIASPETEEYVLSLAKEVDAQARQILDQSPKMSPIQALVLCALNSVDRFKKSEASADHMRAQLTEYLEDAAKARIELDDARRELDRLRRQLAIYQEKDKR